MSATTRSLWRVCGPAVCFLLVFLAGCGQQNDTTGATVQSSAAASVAASVAASAPASAPAAPVSSAAASAPASAVASASASASAEAAASVVPTPAAGEFQNPVLRADFADPHLINVDGTYYAYATNTQGKNIQVARSTDLKKWETLPDAMPVLPKWANPNFTWAPEVMKVGEKYIVYYTARDKASKKQCVGIAVSDKPEGRFKDPNDKPFVCQVDEGGTIDAHPFQDGDKLYLYYKNDGNCCAKPTYLYVQEMTPDGLGLVGEPTRLVRNDNAWEGRVVEAPTMLKHDDKYYLFFSGNDYAGPPYAVGYATCDSPVGPCEDAPENPILESKMDKPPLVVGPGHQTVFQVGDQTWIAYHAWEVGSNGLRGGRRFMYLDKIDWKDGKPDVLGPTLVPQPVPAP